jgi:hypothetical protein
VGISALTVPLQPHPGHQAGRGKPDRRRHREGLERGAQRLGDHLHALQIPDTGQHMRGVRAHPATGAQESQRRAAREDHTQQRMLHAVLNQARPEPRERGDSKPGSVRSIPSAYFQSIRPRTASAA